MVRYANAVFFLISSSALLSADCFQSFSLQRSENLIPTNAILPDKRSLGKPVRASVYSSYDGGNKRISEELKESMQKLTFSSPFEDVDDDDFDNYTAARKDLSRYSANSYTIDLPLSSNLETPLGLSLRQVGKGTQISDLALDLDSLSLVPLNSIKTKAEAEENVQIDDEFPIYTLDDKTLVNLFENNFGPNFEGVIVAEVMENGLAWESGVRIGDVLVATSATMGNKIWPKATLEGVRSAISSRKVMSSSIKVQFRKSRAITDATEVVEKFEMSLFRPMGIEIEDRDGFVVVTGFTDDAKKSSTVDTVQIGDRIVAVDSTIGNTMWPVSNVEGLVSACTTRLPGNPVKLRFERVVEVGEYSTDTLDDAASIFGGAVDGFRQLKEKNTIATEKGAPVSIQSTGSNTHKLLLSRSRDLLRRYMNDQTAEAAPRSALSALPSLVADRVLEALADASAPLDSKTLNLIMTAYTTCRMPDKAIHAFEAATGVAADGSIKPANSIIEGRKDDKRLVPDLKSLDLYTGTSLLRAHALNGDYKAAQRVLAAMEGKAGTLIDGSASISWPMQETTDIRCYNIALAAAAKTADKMGVETAIDIFEGMESQRNGSKAKERYDPITRNLISYNTMIAAFAKWNRSQDALTIFYGMKQVGVKPDKYTYTSLLKALVADGDLEGGVELLQEMTIAGIKADVVTYNTMIKGYCDRLQWYRAKEYVTIMETNGVSPNSLTYGLLMNGLLKANKPSACITLFEAACADERTMSIMENVQLYTTAITAASRLGNYERAVELVARMKKVGVKPNLKTLTTLMSACISTNNPQQAIDVYHQTLKLSKESESFEPDGSFLAIAIKAFSDNGDFSKASEILKEQKDGFHQMSGKDVMFCFNYLIGAALKSGEFGIARTCMTELLSSGYIPSKALFETMISSLDIDTLPWQRNDTRPQIGKTRNTEKLKFLLFVVDSLSERKLPVSGTFYAAILREGVKIGGVGKKVASSMGKAKAQTKEIGDIYVSSKELTNNRSGKWEKLLHLFEENRGEESATLPLLRVQMGKREVKIVLAAESPLVYNSRQRERRTRQKNVNMR